MARKFDNNGDIPGELPSRLMVFVETNPLKYLDFDHLTKMALLPSVNLKTFMTDERLSDLAETDLSKTVRARQSTFNFPQFQSDLGHTVAADYFAKRMRESTKHVKDFWGGYKPSLTKVDSFLESLLPADLS